MRLQPIVEGEGEVGALPVLLRRLQERSGAFSLRFNRPIRQPRSKLVQEESLRRAIRLALAQEACSGILILLDADDDCPKELAPRLTGWAQEEARQIPCEVVLANREYESWFLGSLESLRGFRGVMAEARFAGDPESVRGAWERLQSSMEQSYSKTIDQPAFTQRFDLAAAYRSCRSFRRLVRAFGQVAEGSGISLPDWPPEAWPDAV
jgi:hypothetical protein